MLGQPLSLYSTCKKALKVGLLGVPVGKIYSPGKYFQELDPTKQMELEKNLYCALENTANHNTGKCL